MLPLWDLLFFDEPFALSGRSSSFTQTERTLDLTVTQTYITRGVGIDTVSVTYELSIVTTQRFGLQASGMYGLPSRSTEIGLGRSPEELTEHQDVRKGMDCSFHKGMEVHPEE